MMTIRGWVTFLVVILGSTACLSGKHREAGSELTEQSASQVKLSFSKAGRYADAPGSVILEDGDFLIRAALPAAFQYSVHHSNLYYATFTNPDVIIELSSYGKVEYKDQQRMVLRIDSQDDIASASALLHEKGGSACGGLRLVPLDPVHPASDPASLYAILPGNFEKNPQVAALVEQVKADNIRASVTTLAAFGTRYQGSPQGLAASTWVKTIGYGGFIKNRSDLSVEDVPHQRTQQRSVIARIVGNKNPEKIVIVGSHLDSVAPSSALSPGADDNASGTATAMEAFRILTASGAKFAYTVEFHAYAAEEMGLWGSAEIAAKYRREGKDVVSMMQIDMTGYRANGSEQKIWFISNGTSTALNTALAKLTEVYVGIPTGLRPMTGGTSDHASWVRYGYPGSYPFENPAGSNPHIHTSRDTIDKLDFDFATKFGKLAVGYVSHFALLQEESLVPSADSAAGAKPANPPAVPAQVPAPNTGTAKSPLAPAGA